MSFVSEEWGDIRGLRWLRANWLHRALQVVGWEAAKAVLGDRLDMFFWDGATIAWAIRSAAPGAAVTVTRTAASPWLMIPPVFALPWLRIPRGLYPFDVCVIEAVF